MGETWVLLADGSRAKFLVKRGRSLEQLGETHEHDESGLDIGVGKPGRMREGSHIGTHVYAPQTEWHEFQKQSFAREVAGLVNKANGQFEKLIMIAPPKILGELRKNLDNHVTAKVEREVAKDLTKAPLKEIADSLFTLPLK